MMRPADNPTNDVIGDHSDFLRKIINNVKLETFNMTLDTFFLNFDEVEQNDIVTIRYIGHEERRSTDYYWDNLRRIDIHTDTFVFQYTLAGKGSLEVHQTRYDLTPGKAFFASVPSDIRYFFPEDSTKWEFVFITLTGTEVKKCWEYIQKDHGYVLDISADSPVIQRLIKIHQDIAKNHLDSAFKASGKAYEWLMACYHHFTEVKPEDAMGDELDEPIKQALIFIQTHFNQPITLDEIAASARLSKYYFIKKFKHYLDDTPQSYLVKFRIRAAQDLLLSTSKTVKDIAFEVGFSDISYFRKAFRAITGTSPNEFRSLNALQSFDSVVQEDG